MASHPFHARPPADAAPPLKRHRTQPSPPPARDVMDIDAPPVVDAAPLRLQDLPPAVLRQILSHLRRPFLDARLHTGGQLAFLRAYAPLRLLATPLRDAVDHSVTSLSLTAVPPHAVRPFILHALPHFAALSTLVLYPPALAASLYPVWLAFFSSPTRPRLTSLTYVAPPPTDTDSAPHHLPHLFATHLANSLHTLSTSSMPLLHAFARRASTIANLELLMDGLRADIFPEFPCLHTAKLLYRSRIVPHAAQDLVQALRDTHADLRVVELRLNYLPTSQLAFVTEIPRLRKLSLFDGVVDGDGNGLQVLARCPFLEDVQLEWIKGLTGAHLEKLAVTMGERLKHLKIWNCDQVNDRGLEAVATHCPAAEVELKFERDQFHPRTLARFGDRVSWASYASDMSLY